MATKKKADAAVENTAEVTQESVQEEIEQVIVKIIYKTLGEPTAILACQNC